ncbi:MAG: zf-HC2 domain-containing protein [Gammaproteobacteria bacterium]|nr:zf-HC2 domain-containing protein [Gammaproteobacteria bacterium]
MRNCREITALVSQGLDRKLSFGERIAVNLHVMICSRCRNFQNQSWFLRKAAQRYTESLQNRLSKKSPND